IQIHFASYKSALKCYDWNVTTSISTWPKLGYLVTRSTNGTTNTYGAYKHDFLLVSLGYLGNVTMESPTILKGKYKVELYYGYGTSLSSYRSGGSATQVSFDNKTTVAEIYKDITNSVGVYNITLWDEIEFNETSSHTVKITLLDSRASTDSGYRLQLDYVKFTPIE
ncbi:MAG: DUF5108 domain-containing protein, partial [Odoribacter sp.]|nr:DUF5108 domain-containing protein [Odoribacter sp.]